MTAINVEVLIVGAGPVGVLTALLLKQQGRSVQLCEAGSLIPNKSDTRALALSYASIQALQKAGVELPNLALTPIDTVHVSEQGRLGRCVLNKQELGLPHLGYVCAYQAMLAALRQALLKAEIPVAWESKVESIDFQDQIVQVQANRCFHAQIVILADGGHLARQWTDLGYQEKPYQQHAIVVEIQSEWPHQMRAFERLSHQGPFALLPYGQNWVLVWSKSSEEARHLQANPQALEAQLQAAMGDRIGKIRLMSPIQTYPLSMKYYQKVVHQRCVLIGNAAQTMHPIAAQGLNLGIRDALTLAETFEYQDLSDLTCLADYQKKRQFDRKTVLKLTDGLVGLYDWDWAGLSHARSLGLLVLDTVPSLRKTLLNKLVYG